MDIALSQEDETETINEKDSIIESLKLSNNERQRVINVLLDDVVTQKKKNSYLTTTLEFYADPDTYFAIMFVSDRPSEAFMKEVTEKL